MDETAKVMQMILMALPIMAPQNSKVNEDVLAMLNALASSSESERWKAVGDELLERAKSTQFDSDVTGYCALASLCLGRSVDLARGERAGRKQS
ncbi:hypothetical protein GEV01_25050 [Rugamonas sp. FT103W]|uniref:Uncharacterized protein n=2 Tax=Rugamonas rivuli TaxID=2743358 RepID=A0A843SE18_9BURK|nr:hypothetical protein [Rugamonas rivuli]